MRDLLFPTTIAWKTYVIVIAASLVPALLAVALGGRELAQARPEGYERELSSVCRLLDAELESRHGSFAHLLETEGALAAPREKQIQLLNAELQPIVDMISVAYPDVEFGYYSKDLRAELAIHPMTDAVNIYKEVLPEEFNIYRTGRPEVLRPSVSEAQKAQGGMAVQTCPLYDGDELVGHVWAKMPVRIEHKRLYTAGSLVGLAAVTAAVLLVSSWYIMRGLGHWEERYALSRGAMANREAAAIVHEMRNPITVSKGLVQLVLTQETDMRKRMWLSNIVRQLDHMNNIASDYLQYARPRPPRVSDVSVQELVEDLVENVAPYVEESGAIMEVSSDCEDLKVRCDRDQVGQVLLNLVKNAVEAGLGEPGLRVAIRWRREGGTVIIEVADNGPGIPQENLSRIFDPFFTLKPKGTGLGLAISRTLIEQQGGSLAAHSSQAGGAVFSVKLPRA